MANNSKSYYDTLKDKMVKEGSMNITLAEHAEMWWYEQGNKKIPTRYSTEWARMYAQWYEYAFKDFSKR